MLMLHNFTVWTYYAHLRMDSAHLTKEVCFYFMDMTLAIILIAIAAVIGLAGGVAIGMVMISRAGEALGITEAGTTEQLIAICERNSLPVSCDFSTKTLLDGALSDKKRMGGRIALIIPEKLGKCMTHTVPVDELEHIIDLGKETSV